MICFFAPLERRDANTFVCVSVFGGVWKRKAAKTCRFEMDFCSGEWH